jgi:Flp pilus assembly protein TadB
MADARQCLRNIRIIHFAFLGIPALLFFLLSTLHFAAKAEPTFLPMVLAVLAVSEVGIATTFRGKLIRPAVEKLQRSPHDSAALEQWSRGNILSFVFALTVVLYGAVIRVMGFSWNIAAWFFVAGFFLLLWWTPRMELPVSTNAPAPPPPIATD